MDHDFTSMSFSTPRSCPKPKTLETGRSGPEFEMRLTDIVSEGSSSQPSGNRKWCRTSRNSPDPTAEIEPGKPSSNHSKAVPDAVQDESEVEVMGSEATGHRSLDCC